MAKITRQALGGSLAELARKSGVPRQRLSEARHGKSALSLKAARGVAAAVGSETPISLFVESQLNSIKAKVGDSNKINATDGHASALRAAAAVLDELRYLAPTELAKEAATLEGILEELTATVAEILKGGTDATGATTGAAKKSRDAFGCVVQEPSKVERDVFGCRL